MEHPATISKSIGLTLRKDKLYYFKYSRTGIPFSGKKTHYYTDGKLCFEGDYKQGKPFGIHKYFASDGMVQEISYIEGEINCIEYYYENGELFERTPYKKGLRHGVSKVYDKNGLLVTLRSYKDGELEGVCYKTSGYKPGTWWHVPHKSDCLDKSEKDSETQLTFLLNP